jgi:hypothetical protein
MCSTESLEWLLSLLKVVNKEVLRELSKAWEKELWDFSLNLWLALLP